MKIRITLLSLCMLFISSMAFASFPVTGNHSSETEISAEDLAKSLDTEDMSKVEKFTFKSLKKKVAKKIESLKPFYDDEMLITLVLFLLLGLLAGHRWYRKKPAHWNILFILTGGGLGIWALIDLIYILQGRF